MPFRTFTIVSVLGCALASIASPAHAITAAGVKAVAAAVGGCSDPCVVTSNSGGKITSFKNAGEAIRRGAGQMLVIDGYCGSACMVLADRARPRACITSRATFAYHKTNWNRPLPLSPAIHRWIVQNGPYPEFNGRPGIMPNTVAQRFWRLCKNEGYANSSWQPSVIAAAREAIE
jgi:hypothetical protein